jgi:hypothetical protein
MNTTPLLLPAKKACITLVAMALASALWAPAAHAAEAAPTAPTARQADAAEPALDVRDARLAQKMVARYRALAAAPAMAPASAPQLARAR